MMVRMANPSASPIRSLEFNFLEFNFNERLLSAPTIVCGIWDRYHKYFRSPISARQFPGDFGDVPALEPGDIQFVLRRLATAVGTSHHGGSIWGTPGDLVHVHQSRGGIRHAHDDHPLMQQRCVKR